MKLDYDKPRTNSPKPVGFVFYMDRNINEEGLCLYTSEDNNDEVFVFYHDGPGGIQKAEYFSSENILKYLYPGDKISITF